MRIHWLALCCIAFTGIAAAQEPPAAIALIIDDLGESLADGRRVSALPGPVACAILPHTPHAAATASDCAGAAKEVLLHLPMEPMGENDSGPGKLDTAMPALELTMTLDFDLASVPHAVGVNNHMGSRLTQDRAAMQTVMRALRRRGHLFFVDSLTTPQSVAAEVAREEGLPALARQVFLDDERTPAAIEAQFERLLRIARTQGTALAIGHPYPETLALLERRLPGLAERHVQLISLSAMLKLSEKNRKNGQD